MLPQDPRAPTRQQRWIELENVGSQEIPAYGVVEIVESHRPDSGTDETPDGGRTVIKGQRPTIDSSCDVLVNGHHPIPVGGTAQIGTMDYPTFALYSGTTPVAGEMWGPVKDSFALGKHRAGFVIVGDANADTGADTVRVYRTTIPYEFDGVVTESGGIDADGTGEVELYDDDGNTFSPSSYVTASYRWVTVADNLPSGTKVRVRIGGGCTARIVDHECV